MTRATFFHAGCPVCVAAEQQLAHALDPARFDLEVVHLGERPERLPDARQAGVQSVPAQYRSKTTVIFQSARALKRGVRRRRTFDVAVVGHLREEKDPRLAMHVALCLPAESPVRILHAGAALDARYAAAARRTEARTPRYRWIEELSRSRARQLMRHAALLFHPSTIEGGAQVVLEAIRSGTPGAHLRPSRRRSADRRRLGGVDETGKD